MSLEQVPPPVPYGVLGSTEQAVTGEVNIQNPSTIDSGSGFTVAWVSAGIVDVTFSIPFTSAPWTVAMCTDAVAAVIYEDRSLRTVSKVRLIRTVGGAGTNGRIAFIAYIPSAAKTRVPRDFGFVTALPTTPTPQTGDQCTFVDSLTAPTYTWRLQYNGSDSGSYKWECIGGSPLGAEVSTGETTSSATYAALATAGPSVTVPLAGDYIVYTQAQMMHAAAQSDCRMSYDIGGTGAVDGDWITHRSATANAATTVSRHKLKTGLAASTALVSKYISNAGASAQFTHRRLSVMPVRVG